MFNIVHGLAPEYLKHSINLYDNSAVTTTLFRARTGTLKLNIERRHTDEYTNCEICKENTTEDIEHFLLDREAIYRRDRHIY